MFLSFFSIETFSHKQVLSADRRVKVQNSLVYCLEHMSKYVQQADGNTSSPAVALYPTSCTPGVNCTGFQVRYDCNATQTPSDLTDDRWIYYNLPAGGNNLSVGCKTNLGADCAGSCSKFSAGEELLSSKIVANFNNSVLPAIPTDGFYVKIDPDATTPPSLSVVEIGLVGVYNPSKPYSRPGTHPGDLGFNKDTLLTNPAVAIKARLICNNSSTN